MLSYNQTYKPFWYNIWSELPCHCFPSGGYVFKGEALYKIILRGRKDMGMKPLKRKVFTNFFILFSVISILLTNCSFATAQSQKEYQHQGLFGFQFFMTISWSVNETQEPVRPGEVRTVLVHIAYSVARGAFGNILLHLLGGRPFHLRLSIVDKPDWCTAHLSIEDFIGVVQPDVIQHVYSPLYIQLNEGAPLNHTLGYVKIHGSIEGIKGPFNKLTIIQGYDINATLLFVTSP